MAFRMRNGLSKLVDAAAQVDELRKVLEKNQAVIAVKNVEVQAVSLPHSIFFPTRIFKFIGVERLFFTPKLIADEIRHCANF